MGFSLSDIGHTALDVAGLVPGVGEIADGANAAWYLAEGDKFNAALSAAAMVPGVGSAATAAKWGRRAVETADTVGDAVKTADRAAEGAGDAAKTADRAAEGTGDAGNAGRAAGTAEDAGKPPPAAAGGGDGPTDTGGGPPRRTAGGPDEPNRPGEPGKSGGARAKPDPGAAQPSRDNPGQFEGRPAAEVEKELDRTLVEDGNWSKLTTRDGNGVRYLDGKGGSVLINKGYPGGLQGGGGDAVHQGPYVKIQPGGDRVPLAGNPAAGN